MFVWREIFRNHSRSSANTLLVVDRKVRLSFLDIRTSAKTAYFGVVVPTTGCSKRRSVKACECPVTAHPYRVRWRARRVVLKLLKKKDNWNRVDSSGIRLKRNNQQCRFSAQATVIFRSDFVGFSTLHRPNPLKALTVRSSSASSPYIIGNQQNSPRVRLFCTLDDKRMESASASFVTTASGYLKSCIDSARIGEETHRNSALKLTFFFLN